MLAAAWVDPGRSALQSAEQWCQGRYGRIHQVFKMSFSDNYTSVDPKQLEKSDAYGTLHAAYHILVAVVLVVVVVVVVVVV